MECCLWGHVSALITNKLAEQPNPYYSGRDLLSNFVFKICKAKNNWLIDNFIKNKIDELKKTISNKIVICGLSGGVDSSVTAYLLHKA